MKTPANVAIALTLLLYEATWLSSHVFSKTADAGRIRHHKTRRDQSYNL